MRRDVAAWLVFSVIVIFAIMGIIIPLTTVNNKTLVEVFSAQSRSQNKPWPLQISIGGPSDQKFQDGAVPQVFFTSDYDGYGSPQGKKWKIKFILPANPGTFISVTNDLRNCETWAEGAQVEASIIKADAGIPYTFIATPKIDRFSTVECEANLQENVFNISFERKSVRVSNMNLINTSNHITILPVNQTTAYTMPYFSQGRRVDEHALRDLISRFNSNADFNAVFFANGSSEISLSSDTSLNTSFKTYEYKSLPLTHGESFKIEDAGSQVFYANLRTGNISEFRFTPDIYKQQRDLLLLVLGGLFGVLTTCIVELVKALSQRRGQAKG
ncbi:hypothetical protein PQU94_07655 [Asticcacaulis sp. DXS10W]|uniref:Uncharacterized protein n=1 Tax=Asticcacaulis currens TaxID=2984210 RepID=A0ABT5ID99_9CAUL|nr:hypothetical protein [Asticcacaulis currens]MDC7694158.1 hypothetical protein [Asticcacaulis currens]